MLTPDAPRHGRRRPRSVPFREPFEETPTERAVFDLLCIDVQARLRREIATLRFTKAE